MTSVATKNPDQKDVKVVANDVVKDILEDADKDEWTKPADEYIHNKLLEELQRMAEEEVKAYFLKIGEVK